MNEALVATDSQKSPQLVSGQSTTRKKPSLGKKVWRFFQGNPPALIGGSILVVMVLACLFAPLLTSYDPERRVARPHQAPSAKHLMGTTRSGRDIFSQALHGGRISLSVAFGSGAIAMFIAVLLGMSAGYFGGKVDEWINFITNVVLVFPQVPLLIVLAAFLGQVGPPVIALLIGLTAWPWGTRVIRAQTMALRHKEFVLAAEVMGERRWRIILIEILPNLISIVGGGFIGVVLYALLSQAGLEFLGLGDPSAVTWGTMLYWAQNNSSLFTGAWWDVFTPATIIAVFGGALALINMSIDQVSNPKLKTGPHLKLWKSLSQKLEIQRGQR